MFDATTFLADHFRTPEALAWVAKKYDLDLPARDTIRKWYARGAIPAEWLPVMLMLVELESGNATSILPYMNRQDRGYDIFG